jgi:hypothetical protein
MGRAWRKTGINEFKLPDKEHRGSLQVPAIAQKLKIPRDCIAIIFPLPAIMQMY